jgi:hypothetical protein
MGGSILLLLFQSAIASDVIPTTTISNLDPRDPKVYHCKLNNELTIVNIRKIRTAYLPATTVCYLRKKNLIR